MKDEQAIVIMSKLADSDGFICIFPGSYTRHSNAYAHTERVESVWFGGAKATLD